jgi:site-specific DNA-methyltransferase (adenine-specific)
MIPTVSIIYNEDCLETLKRLTRGSVSLLLQDTPFGATQNEWDIKPDLKLMWPHWERVVKQNGAMIFFATEPFASELILSNTSLFRYDLIWKKGERSSGFLNANKMPLRNHESILVFYRELPTYNPQFLKGKPSHKRGKPQKETNNNYGEYKTIPMRDYGADKFPSSILNFDRPHPPIHPTQKPVSLFRYLIKTYSNEGDIVFDGYVGSGTTAIACIEENRLYVCSEKIKKYFIMTQNRIKEVTQMPKMKFAI